jgi:DegV family protein with EDD domain
MAVDGGQGRGNLRAALAAGCACTAAWAEVLDRINVFPVPDGDTGRNLVLSLSPLRDQAASDNAIAERLLLSARGNSGNIACAFVRALFGASADESLPARCVLGAVSARRAVANPQPGTMLTVLDALAGALASGLAAATVPGLLASLARVVQDTPSAQESLRSAGVVDSGALGMLVFLDGMLRTYYGLPEDAGALAVSFRSLVRFQRPAAVGHAQPTHQHASQHASDDGFCVDAILRIPPGHLPPDEALAGIGSEVVALREGELWKIHLHARDAEEARVALGGLGEVVGWSWDDLGEQMSASLAVANEGDVHIVTDGAASLSRREAEALGVTLLDSHIDFGDRSLPETRLDPDDVYRAMRRGVRVTTAQASSYERHMHYERLAAQWKNVLYLCVGSVYTGNHAVASAWRAAHASGEGMTVLDSGAASGRLAVVVRAMALAARGGTESRALASMATSALHRAEEYIFPECLEYLARGGRLSKTSAWFGDAIGLAPVVSPMPDGARKVAMLRKPEYRVAFACERVAHALSAGSRRGYLLAEYTDNRAWVEGILLPRLRQAAPEAEIALGPLSLTTGAHTGPGTWAVALLPDLLDS